VTVHNFSTTRESANEEYPTPVTIDIMDMHPFSLDMSRSVKVKFKEEVSVFSFMVDNDGNIYDMNDQIDTKIRPNIGIGRPQISNE
jgi:hypothetical protein